MKRKHIERQMLRENNDKFLSRLSLEQLKFGMPFHWTLGEQKIDRSKPISSSESVNGERGK